MKKISKISKLTFSKIFKAIKKIKSCTVNSLAKETGFSKLTIYLALKELLLLGRVKKSENFYGVYEYGNKRLPNGLEFLRQNRRHNKNLKNLNNIEKEISIEENTNKNISQENMELLNLFIKREMISLKIQKLILKVKEV